MRGTTLLLLGATLASCSTAPEPLTRSAQGQRDFARLTAGKIAGPPLSCVRSYDTSDMTVIDGRTIMYRNGGGGTAYMVQLSEGCELIGRGHYALSSRKFGTADTCTGDIQQVLDTVNRISVGSCVIQNIVPYSRPR